MNNHTLSSYDRQLDQITQYILDMGGRVKKLLEMSKTSLSEPAQELVDAAKALDKEINSLEYKLENQATVVLALQNPMAVDLRFVTSALKVAGALERAGDLAKNTVKRSFRVGKHPVPGCLDKLESMVDIIITMLDDAISAIQSRDPKKAIQVWKRDDQVDDLYHDVLALMQKEMGVNTDSITACTHMMFAAKNFERIADYATDIAKTVHYIASGKPADKALLKEAAAQA